MVSGLDLGIPMITGPCAAKQKQNNMMHLYYIYIYLSVGDMIMKVYVIQRNLIYLDP